MTIVKKPHIPRIAPCHGLGLVVFFVTYGLFILISPSLFHPVYFFILYYVQKIYGRSEYFGVFTQYTHCEYTRYSVLFFQFYLYIVFICKYILFYCSTIQTRCIFISQDTISYEKQKKPRSNKLQNFSFIVFCCCKGIL